jgi:hypothetical protein
MNIEGRGGPIIYVLTCLWAGMSREGEIYKDIGLTAGVGEGGGETGINFGEDVS